ncbi:MAG: 4-hydroxythreonine-4-phosphate dehydrogenase PdxA [Vicinamibacterales bacterium]
MHRVRVGITVGDPAGIGPEIAARAVDDPRVLEVCEPVVFGPGAPSSVRPGEESAESGRQAYDIIVRAVDAARRGDIDAVATSPISKRALSLAGLPWKGHTDLLAHLCGVDEVRMLFYAEGGRSADGGPARRPLCVTLATVHVPLADVPRLLTIEGVARTITMTAAWLSGLGFAAPRVALAGLNPHAGEARLLGDEDEDVLRPAVAAARRAAWTPAARGRATPCSCGPSGASSTPWSPAITTRASSR